MCVCHDKLFAVRHSCMSTKFASQNNGAISFVRLSDVCVHIYERLCPSRTQNRISVLIFRYKQTITKIILIDFLSFVFLFISSFTPVYVFMIFLHATLLFHMQSGPMWPHMADSERSVCRSHFWTNLLYINNFVESHEPVNLRYN